MKLFYKKKKFSVGDQKVEKIVGSQIVKIIPNRSIKSFTGIIYIFAGLIFLSIFSISDKANYFHMIFITISLLIGGTFSIYQSFTKFDFKFNTFLKTVQVKKRKITFEDIDSIQYAPAKYAFQHTQNETYDYVALLVLKSGEKVLILEDKHLKDLLLALEFIAEECSLDLTLLKIEF